MKITAIKKQARRGDRFSIYAGDTYLFSLGESELLRSGIHLNQELTDAQLKSLQETAALDKAYDRVLLLIARRQRSEWEIDTYLKQKGYSEELRNKLRNKLRNSGYINDRRFAEAWVRNRRLLKSTSKRRLTQELRQKRVADSVIKETLEQDEADELDILRNLVARKRKQTRYQDDQKLMQYLIRQGYNYGDVRAVLEKDTSQQ